MTNFNNQQIKVFKKLFAHPPMTTALGNPEKFLLQFVLFEASVRLVGTFYRNRINNQKKVTGHESLNIDVVRRTFLYFDISVSDERLSLLLDSKLTKRNQKSARALRNGLAHRWHSEDVNEVTARYEILSHSLAEVVDQIKLKIIC